MHRTLGTRSLAFTALAVIAMLGALIATTSYARASPSDKLAAVLSNIRGMFDSDFSRLVKWAKNGAPTPDDDSSFDPEKTEVLIDKLDGDDRHAVLDWLRGNGRSDLHSQGASDSDIGPSRTGADSPAATPTPNAWRNIPLATSTLDNAAEGKIQILGGFAAVKKDGTSAIACVSFKNLDPRVAKHVVVEYPLLGGDNTELGKLVLDRTGEFSPNVDIKSFESMGAWQTAAMGPKAYGDSCVTRNLPTPALPFLQARAAGYHVTKVEYADGTSWTASGAQQ